jgi:predicted ester cyclase
MAAQDRRHELPRLINEELIVRGNWNLLDELLAPEFVSHGAAGYAEGPQELRALVEPWRGAFPDLSVRVADQVVEGDLAGWRIEGSGTHQGPLASPIGEVPATGKRVRLVGIDLARLGQDGRAVEHWSGPDLGILMADLGLAPPGEAPPAPDRPAPESGDAPARDEAEATIRGVFDLVNSGEFSSLGDVVHPDYVDHSPIGDVQGHKGFEILLGTFRGALGEFRAEPEMFVVEGTRAAWRTRITGVHTGELMGIPATGNRIDVYSNEFGRVAADGRAAEHWSSLDMVTFMTQLGVFPAVGANA